MAPPRPVPVAVPHCVTMLSDARIRMVSRKRRPSCSQDRKPHFCTCPLCTLFTFRPHKLDDPLPSKVTPWTRPITENVPEPGVPPTRTPPFVAPLKNRGVWSGSPRSVSAAGMLIDAVNVYVPPGMYAEKLSVMQALTIELNAVWNALPEVLIPNHAPFIGPEKMRTHRPVVIPV